MPAAALAETVDRVARAASRDEVRPILTGILVSVGGVDPDDGRHRLLPALRQADRARAAPSREPLEANVPARAMRELAPGRRPERVEEVEIALPGNQVVFRAGDVALSSRLIEGQFPNYRQLLPERSTTTCGCRAASCSTSTRRIRYLAQRNAPLQARLRGGGADGRGGDARDRRRQRGDAVRRSAARRWRSRSTRSSSSRGSRASRPRSSSCG